MKSKLKVVMLIMILLIMSVSMVSAGETVEYLKIKEQPRSATAAEGVKAKVTVEAEGEGLTYKWYYKDKDATKFKYTSTFKTKSYSVEMNNTRNKRQVYCVVYDKYGNSIKTDTATLTKGTTLKITKEPSSVAVVSGSTAKVNITASGSGLTYKWYYKNKGDKNFVYTKTFTGKSYSVAMNDARNGRQVYCIITDKYGSSVKTKTATLSKKTALKITNQPKSVITPKGTTAAITVSAQGDGLKYQWYFKNAGASKFSLTKSFTGNKYSLEMASSRDGRQVYCVITDKYGSSIKTSTVTLRMGNPLKITGKLTSVTVPKDAKATLKVTATGDSLKYGWYYKDKGASKFALSTSITGNTYSVAMNDARDGRQLYCVVSDKHGTSIKTNTVTIHMGTPLEITEQPTSVAVEHDAEATVTVVATGDALEYAWYIKDKDGSEFVKSNVTNSSYSITMSKETDGRQAYCVITDKNKNSIITETVTLSINHDFGDGEITKEATCKVAGEKTFICSLCDAKYVETIAKGEHTMGDWVEYKAATVYEKGVERSSCSVCSYYKDRETEKLEPVYYITADIGQDEPLIIGVGENGKYSLDKPTKKGSKFEKWQDEEGNDFPAKGTIDKDINIIAVWNVDETTTLAQLIQKADEGITDIKIAADIIVDQPIYISHKTRVFSDGDYTLKRAAKYDGDIFVVGRDKSGNTSVSLDRKAVLTLGAGKGTLTVDGNKDEVDVNVVGSAVFVADSAKVNIKDGVQITNNKKVGNKRYFDYEEISSAETISKAGGAAILNYNGTVNIYGGIIDNNIVATSHTEGTDTTGAIVKLETNGCGGAIYNRGTLYMYGGKIANNEALRGGAVYNDRNIYLKSGVIESNLSHTYGGAVSSSSSANAEMYIGEAEDGDEMIFRNNKSKSAGGALYSSTASPILVYGNTVFENNATESSGGAIYTAGPLDVAETTFKGNRSVYSGGAVYHHYSNPDYQRRFVSLENCKFENNISSLGGAVILSASETVSSKNLGTKATITGCEFNGNSAEIKDGSNGNGGAIYVTRKSEATINDCTFANNEADNSAGGVSVHSQATVKISNAEFAENTGVTGGAMYVAADTNVTLYDVVMSGNKAVKDASGNGGNGGGIYLYNVEVPMDNVDFYNNSAETNAGAIYQSSKKIDLDSKCEFIGNSAGGHGGAIYLTYITKDGVHKGAVLNAKGVTFKDGSASAGGAVSARTATTANFTDCNLIGNTATGTKLDAAGGGAVYAGYAEVTMKSVTADGNTSNGYSGVVNAFKSTATLEDCELKNNTANTGGAMYLNADMTVALKDIVFSGNKAVKNESEKGGNGGALYIDQITANIDNLDFYENSASNNGGAIYQSAETLDLDSRYEFDGNTAGNHGGAIYLVYRTNSDNSRAGAVLNAEGVTFENGLALAGGAISARSACEINLNNSKLLNNAATGVTNDPEGGGAIYVGYGTANLTKVEALGNSSLGFGGVMELVSAKTKITDCKFENNNALNGGVAYALSDSQITVNNSSFNGNRATNNVQNNKLGGGALAIVGGTLDLTDVSMDGNISGYYGGAVLANGTTLNLVGKSEIKNSEAGTGGALYLANSTKAKVENTVIKNNEATANGVIYTNSGTLDIDNADIINNSGHNGGVMYVSGGKITINESNLSGNSGVSGGALYVKNATVTAINVELNENTATYGGAANINEAAKVTFNNVDFIKNSASKNGGALSLTGNTLNLDDTCAFDENTAGEHGGSIYLTYKKNENGDTITYEGSVLNAEGVVFKNGKALAGGAISARSDCVANLTDVDFINNEATGNTGDADGGGAIYVGYGAATLDGVSATGNTSAGFGGVIHSAGSVLTINDAEFSDNDAGTGGAIYGKASSKIYLTGSQLEGNEAENGGAFYSSYSDVELKDITFSENNVTNNGGALYLNSVNATVDNIDFVKNSAATHAGAVYLLATELNVDETCKFDGNIAGKHGGAYYLTYRTNDDKSKTGSVLNAEGTTFENGRATAGGAISARSECVANLTDVKLINNEATGTGNDGEGGGALYVGYGAVTLDGVSAKGNKSAGHGGVMVLVNSDVTMSGGTFEANTAPYGGAVNAISKSKIIVNESQFINNEATYEENDTEIIAGGGAFNVENSSLDLSSTTFDGNTALEHGGALSLTSATVDMSDCEYKYNSASSGGAVNATTESKINVEESQFVNNESTYVNSDWNNAMGGGAFNVDGGSLEISSSTLDGNVTDYYGGAILSHGATVAIEENSVAKNTTGTTGGTLFFGSESNVTIEDSSVINNTTKSNGTVYFTGGSIGTLKNVEATGNNGVSGGVLFTSGNNTTVTVSGGNFSNNSGTNGGVANVQNANVTFNNVVMNENRATLGGALFNKNGVITVSGSEFSKNSATNNGGAISIAGGTVIGEGENIFTENEAYGNGDKTGYGGAIYVAYHINDDESKLPGILKMTGGKFNNNTAKVAGGAVAARTECEIELTNTELAKNIASSADSNAGGGAIFANNNTIVLSNVIIEENETGYYGGAITALDSNVTIKDKTKIDKNVGVTGAAINFRGTGSYTLEDSSVTNHVSDSGNGVLYITGSGTLNLDKFTATGNSRYNGGVLYSSGNVKVNITDSELKNNSIKENGGAIFYSSSGSSTITGTTISNNTAKRGGAIYATGTGKLEVKSSTLSENVATEIGGAINATGKNNVVVSEDTVISNNTAPKGGGIHADLGSTITVNKAKLEGNSATGGEGGAILVADSTKDADGKVVLGTEATKLVMTNAEVIGNTASTKGGGISTDESSLNLLMDVKDTLFKNNKSTSAGGAAVEIQNGNCNSAADPTELKLVFTNCIFEGNEAKTTGAGIEIRTSSCAKVNGIEATGNKAAGNGSVFYVTSENSRLYLTGKVEASGNTAVLGNFAYLYNNKYKNPPKIYTSDSNTATWYKDVKGNPQNVVFDVKTMP